MDQGQPPPEKLTTLLHICQKMNSERDLGTLLDLIAHESTHLLEAERATIFLLDREANELWSKVALGSSQILRFDARLGVAGAATMSGELINVSDAYQDRRFYAGFDESTGFHTRTLLAAPLRNYAGEILGAFEVVNKRSGTFTGEDEEILKSLAAHAAVAIQTAQLVGDLRRDREELAEQNTQLRREVGNRFATSNIIGASEPIQEVLRLIERIRDSSVNVLITGESGTGKELVARAIHYSSRRAHRPFVALNCAALPETLVESELFGVERGVATGVMPRIGQFEAAAGGTLFLDEIGDLSLTAQAKILRVLQERVVERLGGRRPVPVDVRVLSATNKDLEGEIRQGKFREDLYYRLKVVYVRLPSLRAIRQDIPHLANHFLAQQCRETGEARMEYSPGALARLTAHDWPGNVRQLENEVKRLVACARGSTIQESEVLEGMTAGVESERPSSMGNAVEALERRMILDALGAAGGNQSQAARMLGLSRQGLIKKMKRYGLSAGSLEAGA